MLAFHSSDNSLNGWKNNFDNITKALFFYVKKSPIAADTIKKHLGTKSGKKRYQKDLKSSFQLEIKHSQKVEPILSFPTCENSNNSFSISNTEGDWCMLKKWESTNKGKGKRKKKINKSWDEVFNS